MFSGLIFSFYNLFFLKYCFNINFFFIRIIKNLYLLNIGESISIQGICLTLIYKFFFFFEFEFSYISFLNIEIFKKIFYNFEFCLKLHNNINGHYLYGHINNRIISKNIFFLKNIIKIHLFFYKNLKIFFSYKASISINGISLTINEFIFFNDFLILSLNILPFTYFFTNIKFLKIFDILNIEFDIFIYFILNFLFF